MFIHWGRLTIGAVYGHISGLKMEKEVAHASMELSIRVIPKATNFSRCVICQLDNLEEPLRCAKKESVSKLISVLKIRSCEVYHRLGDSIIPPQGERVQWHANCYASCTSSHNLRSAIKKRRTVSPEAVDTVMRPVMSTSGDSSGRLTRSATVPFDSSKCLFCKMKTHKKVKEMFNIATTDACDNLINKAEAKFDDDMLKILRGARGDLVAADVKYHKDCQATYVSNENLKYQSVDPMTTDDRYVAAFSSFPASIEDELHGCKAFDMSTLLELYINILEEHGVVTASSYKA